MTQQEINDKLDTAARREAKVTELYERLGCTIAHARVLVQEEEIR